MADWVARLDAFLAFNEYDILTDAGSVSHEVARKLAEDHYDVFRVRQDGAFESDFDREVKRITRNVQPPATDAGDTGDTGEKT
jgi:hypothetical protein